MKAIHQNLCFECPECDQTIDAEPELAGTKGNCPHCKERIIVPCRCQECGRMMTGFAKKCGSCKALDTSSFSPRRSKRRVTFALVVGVVIWWTYEYEHDKSEREGIRLRDEAKRKMDDYHIRQMAAGRYDAPVRVQIVHE